MEKNLSAKNIIEDIKKSQAPVIIFGAGIVGEVLLAACREAGIKVECFCDSNIYKTKNLHCGLAVAHAPELPKKYPTAVFIISSTYIQGVIEQLKALGYRQWYGSDFLLKDFDISRRVFSESREYVRFSVDACLLSQAGYLNPDKLFLRNVDIMITERCSLKCRDCSNLMQYYKKPQDDDLDELIRAIDKFSAIVDEVFEYRIIGGDALVSQDFLVIAQKLISEPKAGRVVVYTNGTIPLNQAQLAALRGEKKIIFIITDYGPLSRNLNTLVDQLKAGHIAFHVQKAGGWTDCANITPRHRQPAEQKKVFKNCCLRYFITLSKGRLYLCPFAANADRLRAVPDFKNDYIDLEENIGLAEMKAKVKKLILEKDCLEVCDYCSGRAFGDPEITPAVQAPSPREYQPYPRESGGH